MKIDNSLTAPALKSSLQRVFDASAAKIRSLESSWDPASGSPVFTSNGKYTSRGWTEWTQGFQFGSAILQYDVTGEADFVLIITVASMSEYEALTRRLFFGNHNVKRFRTLVAFLFPPIA